jgi:hypothetical protein
MGYTSKNIQLTHSEFVRYVKPQLLNISQDYQTLIAMLNPHLKPYKTVFNHYHSLKINDENFRDRCNIKSDAKCSDHLVRILKSLKSILTALDKSHPPEKIKNYGFNGVLDSFSHFQGFRNELFDIYLQVFNYSFFYKANIKYKSSNTSYYTPELIIKRIEQSYNKFNIFLITSSDKRFKEVFFAYWNSFIKPITRVVLTHNDKKYFLRNLNDYNLRWNVLNIELTKRNKTVSKQVHTLLNAMHRRWNRILKTTLRRN